MHKLIPDLSFELSKETAETANKINRDWNAVQLRREKNEPERKRLASFDPASYTPEDLKARSRAHNEAIAILQAEIPILKRYQECWRTINEHDSPAAFRNTVNAVEEAASRVRARMKEIGFTDTDGPSVHEAALEHPDVAPLVAHAMELNASEYTGLTPTPFQIEQRIEKAERELRALVEKV